MDKYGRKAMEYLEKIEREEPNEKTLVLRSAMLINIAGDKIMDIMSGEMENYDGGMRREYARGRGRYARRDSMGRYRYEGRMMDDMDDEYYDGGGYYDGRSGSDGRSGGTMGGRTGGMR